MTRVNYEARFYIALKRITAYMTTNQMRRESSGRYGLEYTEFLEMAYENVMGEAKAALKGYRPKKEKQHMAPGNDDPQSGLTEPEVRGEETAPVADHADGTPSELPAEPVDDVPHHPV